MMNHKLLFLLIAGLLCSFVAAAQPRQGQPAAEIALPAVNGDTVRLSSLRGKVVLLDFWASWCVPCRGTNRELTKLYPKYKDKGFEILGVSFDEDTEKWKAAIVKDKISWLQVNEPGKWDARTAINWQISALPTSFLIDRDGTLLAMDLTGKALEKALKHLIDK